MPVPISMRSNPLESQIRPVPSTIPSVQLPSFSQAPIAFRHPPAPPSQPPIHLPQNLNFQAQPQPGPSRPHFDNGISLSLPQAQLPSGTANSADAPRALVLKDPRKSTEVWLRHPPGFSHQNPVWQGVTFTSNQINWAQAGTSWLFQVTNPFDPNSASLLDAAVPFDPSHRLREVNLNLGDRINLAVLSFANIPGVTWSKSPGENIFKLSLSQTTRSILSLSKEDRLKKIKSFSSLNIAGLSEPDQSILGSLSQPRLQQDALRIEGPLERMITSVSPLLFTKDKKSREALLECIKVQETLDLIVSITNPENLTNLQSEADLRMHLYNVSRVARVAYTLMEQPLSRATEVFSHP